MVSGTRDNPTPSYHGREIFPLICLKNFVNRLHEVGETTRNGELSCLDRQGNLGRRDNFFICKQVRLLTRDEAAKLNCARMRCPRTFALYLQLNIPQEEGQNFGGWYILPAFALKRFFAPKSSLQSTDTVDYNKMAFIQSANY